MKPAPVLLVVGMTGMTVSLLVLIRLLLLENRSLWGSIRCFFRGRHDPRRQPLGFRCSICRMTGAGLEAFGFHGYVSPARPLYERDVRGFTRRAERET